MKKILLVCLTSLFVFGFGAKESQASSNTYTVKPGDTLYRISINHNTSVANIKKWNNLSSNTIFPNQKLVIGSQAAAAPSNPPTSTVKPATKKEFIMQSTAYTASCKGCSGITKTGINLKKNPNVKVIAVDPKVIPLGTKVFVEGYGEAIAGDIGGAIKGNKIDVFISNYGQALQWGRKTVKVQILD